VAANRIPNPGTPGYGHAGAPLDKSDPIADSVNIAGQAWLTAWLFRVGLRYHGLHHLLPDLPYHQPGRVHQRLAKHLPPEHPYHRCNRRRYFAIIAELLSGAWLNRRRRVVTARWQNGS